jgi:hypothetical protein
MKRLGLILAVLSCFWFEPTLAQFKRPHQVAYNSADKKFIVSNRKSGDIITIDGNKSTSTVITGLDRPRGIFFGSIGGNSAVAILDSNLVRLFDPSSYQPFINLTVPNALGLEDAVLHPSNSNIFFLTDPGSGRVIKATVGSPPFYPVTFTTFNDDITKPNAMMVDHKGRLLVASDTVDGGIYSLNLSTGKETLVKSLELDRVNSITQDGQNNYYISNWGDGYVYRFNSNLSDSVRVTVYSDPSGLIYHAPKDELVIACSGCNKVDFIKLHQFELTGGFDGCPGDTFEVYQSFWFKSVGTFESNNKFILEVSDDKGSFQSATILDVQDTTEFPGTFRGVVPRSKGGTRYLRVRSTHPEHFSKGMQSTIRSAPERSTFSPTNVNGCEGDTAFIGRPAQTHVIYAWTSNQTLSDNSAANPWWVYSGNDSVTAMVLAEDTTTGCLSRDTITAYSNPKPTILFPDTFVQCNNDTLRFPIQDSHMGSYIINGNNIGIDGFPDFWESGLMIDTQLYFQFKSSINSCEVRDTAEYIFRTAVTMPKLTFAMCEERGFPIVVRNDHTSNGVRYTGTWSSNDLEIDYTNNRDSVIFNSKGKTGTLNAFGEVDAEGCIYRGSVTVDVSELPEFNPDLKVTYSDDSVFVELIDLQGDYELTWRNGDGTPLNKTGNPIGLKKQEEIMSGDSVMVIAINGLCLDTSEAALIEYSVVGLENLKVSELKVFPNPTSGKVTLPRLAEAQKILVTDVYGRTTYIPYSEQIDLATYRLISGIYWLTVEAEDVVWLGKVVVE